MKTSIFSPSRQLIIELERSSLAVLAFFENTRWTSGGRYYKNFLVSYSV
jgi:hypothetical protein